MKVLISLVFLMGFAIVAAHAQVISWNDDNGNSIPADGTAGFVPVRHWNNSNPKNDDGLGSLTDNSGARTACGFSITGTYGGWGITAIGGIDADKTHNRTLLAGYANMDSNLGKEYLTITNIPYAAYDLIVYFSSDVPNRSGTVACSGAGRPYYFSTIGASSVSGPKAFLIPATDTTGSDYLANYAVFKKLTGSSKTITLNIPDGGGIAGFQIVSTAAANHN